jgi:hypothetical protein
MSAYTCAYEQNAASCLQSVNKGDRQFHYVFTFLVLCRFLLLKGSGWSESLNHNYA